MVAAREQQDDTTNSGQPEPSIRHLTNELQARAVEFGAYAKYLLLLQVDRFKLTARRIAFYAILGIAAIVVVGAALVAGTGLLLLGVSGLIGQLVGSFWLGATIVGVALLAGLFLAAVIALRVIDRRALASLRRKYEGIRQKQKEAMGRNIREVADAR